MDEAVEEEVVKYALEFSAHGQHRTSNELRKKGVIFSEKLKSLEVPVELEVFSGMIHVFAQLEILVSMEINRLVQSISKFILNIISKILNFDSVMVFALTSLLSMSLSL